MEDNQNNSKKLKEKKKKYIIIGTIITFLIILITAFITYKITSQSIIPETEKEIKKVENNKETELKDETQINENNKETELKDETQINENDIESNEKEDTKNSQIEEDNQTNSNIYSENDVIKYFEEEENYIVNNNQSAKSTSRIKSAFQNIYGFLFKGEAIKGYKFKELTTSAKLKVLKLALSIDSKIDKYFPDYKENIKEKGSSLKEKAITEYLEITANICESNQELCKSASEDFNTMKKNYKLGISIIKGIIANGSDKLKNWWSNK